MPKLRTIVIEDLEKFQLDEHDRLYWNDKRVRLFFPETLGYQGPDNPLNGLDGDAVFAWIDNYCRAHPLDSIVKATEAFDAEHPN
jgi:hypothetical protein